MALCLPARPDDADGRCIGPREVLRRHSGYRTGPLLSEPVRLDHSDEFPGGDVDQVHPESDARARRRVILEPGIAPPRPRCEHDVDRGLSRSDPLARAVCGIAPSQSSKSFLDGRQRIVHAEKALDILFCEKKRSHPVAGYPEDVYLRL